MLTPNQDYTQELTCIYKDETYSVRDNGAVLRHSRDGKRKRKEDDVWTFGKQNPKNGYMYLGLARIHQIVATAFHGKPTDKNLVVDHKDSNKCNNRPENLHWVTRLENALNNPTTRWKIEMRCGSIEAFLENPSILNDYIDEDPNFSWMRTVSKEEGERTLKNMENWAKKRQVPSGKGILGEWIYNTDAEETEELRQWRQSNLQQNDIQLHEWQKANLSQIPQSEMPNVQQPEEADIKPSLTPNAFQRKWKTETEFPCCPTDPNATLDDYFSNLHSGVIFTRNNWHETILLDCAIVDDSILVLSKSTQENPIKPWCLCRITKEGQFVHENLGSFFEEKGARKQYTLKQGLEWTGGDSIDDYC